MHVVLLPNPYWCILVVTLYNYRTVHSLYKYITVLLGEFAICRLAIAIVPRVLHYSASCYYGVTYGEIMMHRIVSNLTDISNYPDTISNYFLPLIILDSQ